MVNAIAPHLRFSDGGYRDLVPEKRSYCPRSCGISSRAVTILLYPKGISVEHFSKKQEEISLAVWND